MLIFSFLIFCIMPILSAPIIGLGLIIDRNRYKWYVVLLSIVLAIVGYSFMPNADGDLVRHFIAMDRMQGQKIIDILSNSNGLFFQDIVFYFVSCTNNYYLLPAISGFFMYWSVFYIIADYAQREKVSHILSLVFMTLFVLILGFQTPFSGIRNSWAFSMMFLAIYREFIQKRRGVFTYILYIVPLFLHFSSLVMLALRLVMPIYKKINLKVAIIITIAYPLMINEALIIFERLASKINYFNSFFVKMDYTSQKLNNEFTIAYSAQSGDIVNTIRKLVNTSSTILICILVFLCIYYIYKRDRISYDLYKNYYLFIMILAAFSITSISYIVLFDRFATSIIFIASPVFITYWKMIKKDNRYKEKIFVFGLISLYLFIFGIVFTIKRNSNYPEWMNTFPEALVKNIFNAFIYKKF